MSDPKSSNSETPLTLRRFLVRGWPAVVLGVIIGLAAGAAAEKAQTPQYASTTAVLVKAIGVDSTTTTGSRTTGEVNLDTEAVLVKSTAVLDRTRKLLKTKDTDKTIAGNIAVTVPANSAVLNITYTAGTPKAAQAGSAAVASSYLADRKATATGQIAAQIALLNRSIKTTTTALNTATANSLKYKSTSSSGQEALSQKALLSSRLTALNASLDAEAITTVDPGAISSAATLPTRQAGLSKALFLASGLAVGLLIGLVGAWLLARRPVKKLRRGQDVEGSIGIPVIARIDELQMGELAAATTPAAETYRRLVNIVTASLHDQGRIVLIAGSDDTEMASTVTHNIAATLSRSGERVAVLVPAADRAEPTEGGEDDSVYRILPSTGPRTRQAIQNLRHDEDGFVLIDTPEPIKTADAQSYGAAADAVIIVLRSRSSVAYARRIVAEFDAVSAPVLGAVLVNVARGGSSARMIEQGRPARHIVNGPAIANGPANSSSGPANADGPASDGAAGSHATDPHNPARTEMAAGESPISDAGRRVLRRNDRVRARADRD